MRLNITALFTVLFLFTTSNIASANFTPFKPSKYSSNKEIVIEEWNSAEDKKRFEQSKYKADFYNLVNFFQPQINPFYCGIASSVMILNAFNSQGDIPSQKPLEGTRPKAFGGGQIEFKSYSQITFLNEITQKIKDRNIIELKNFNDDKSKIDPGLSLDQLAAMLQAYNLKTKTVHVSRINSKELEAFKETLKAVLNDKENFILVNFKGDDIGLKTGGHISPVVAFDEASSSVLMMDVASHNNPWYWVNVDHLYKAMNSKDGKQYRGYLIVSK